MAGWNANKKFKFLNVLYDTFVSSQLRFFSFSFSGQCECGCQKSAVEGLLYAFKFTLGNFNDLFMRKVQNEKISIELKCGSCGFL